MSISSDASKPSSVSSNLSALGAALRAFASYPIVASIREALPYSFAGLVAALLVLMPLVRVASAPNAGAALAQRVAAALLPALAVMAVALVFVLAARIARRCAYPAAPFVATCAAAFALALPRPFAGTPLAYMATLGGCGLFLAMLVCALVAAAFALARRTASAPAIATTTPAIANTLAIAAALAFFGGLFAAGISPANLLLALLHPLGRLGDSYAALLIVVFVQTTLWIAGVHGPAVLAAIVTPLYLTLQTQNAGAYAHHRPLPHIVVVSLFLFVFPGGSGATLPLAVMLAFSRVPRLRTIGRVSLLPALVNTNEPLLFGLPIVFNPILAVPFIGVPLVLATITYLAVAGGWVGRPIYYVPSSVPTLLSTYLATFDWRAIVLTALNVAVAAALYLPFVRAYERHVAATSAVPGTAA